MSNHRTGSAGARMTVSINIRIGSSEKKWLAETAAIKGMTLSGFLRQCAREEAHKVLGPPKIETERV